MDQPATLTDAASDFTLGCQKDTGEPGAQTIWIGLQRVMDCVIGLPVHPRKGSWYGVNGQACLLLKISRQACRSMVSHTASRAQSVVKVLASAQASARREAQSIETSR